MLRSNGNDICRRVMRMVLILALFGLTGCGVIQPTGLIYTHIRLPLTKNLHLTPLPTLDPPTGRVLEVKEPFSGFGIYARVDSNAIGDIARQNGIETLYFADQEIFSILGVWTTTHTILYGE